MDKLLNFFERKFQKQVLSVIYDNGNWYGSLIEKNGDDLDIIASFASLEKISEVLAENSLLPIVLGVQDTGILHYTQSEHFTHESALQFFEEEVPNTDSVDFLICFHENAIAFGRENLIASVVSSFGVNHSNVVGVSLAPVFGIELAKILSVQNQSTALLGYSYSFENQTVFLQVNKDQIGAVLDGIDYDYHSLVSLALALDHFESFSQVIHDEAYSLNREQVTVSKVFSKAKMPVLLTLLVLLLVNGLVYFSLSETNTDLKDKAGTLEILDDKLNSLNSFIASNQTLLLVSKQPGIFSIIADQIGSSLSNGIKLTRLVIHPEEDERSASGFLKDKLVLEGTAISSEVMSDWVSILEEEEWVQEIEKQRYEGTPLTKSGKFQITIRLYVE